MIVNGKETTEENEAVIVQITNVEGETVTTTVARGVGGINGKNV